MPSYMLHDARVWWSLWGVAGTVVALSLASYAAQDRRNAIRGVSCFCGWRILPRYLRVDRDNARDVQSWTSLRRTVADVVIQAGVLAVRGYAITWGEPHDPALVWQRWLGGTVITALLVLLALVGTLDYRDRRRLVASLLRHPDGDCGRCGTRVAEDYLFCPHCGLGRTGRPATP